LEGIKTFDLHFGSDHAEGQSYEAMERAYIEKISLRRMVTADDVANQALFLCSELGRNISGQAISICGNVEYL
jgi:enoyl-[acyl-carrier-protein] reductase (NADH)